MKFKYVVPLEFLRIIGSASRIIDAKNTNKTVLEYEKLRKPSSKNRNGLLWNWYVYKELDKVILKQVLETKMGKIKVVFCGFKYNSGERISKIYMYMNSCV